MPGPRLNAAERAARLRVALLMREQGCTFQQIADKLYNGHAPGAWRAIRDAQRRGVIPVEMPGVDHQR